jgi:actin related protein 2/3 complex, subunit 5
MSNINYRTVNVDAYDPDSSLNFPISSVLPSSLPAPSTSSEAASLASQIRQLLRAGDSLGALQSALETAPLAGDESAKQVHLTTVLEVLQGIRQSDVSRILNEMLKQQGGNALGDTLMKYLYKGMGQEKSGGGGSRGMSPQGTGSVDGGLQRSGTGGFSQIQARNFGEGGGGQTMSVLLSWHEKLVEVVGVGGIVRVMSDRRTV